MNDKRELLRHCVATLAYRGGKVLRNAPPDFANFRAHETTRTPAQILAHIGDLLDWATSVAIGKESWATKEPTDWDADVQRFFTGLATLDGVLASEEPLGATEERLFQAPIADALTHVGQLAMLCRMAGKPVRGENYSKAKIESGRVGTDQTPPKFEFD